MKGVQRGGHYVAQVGDREVKATALDRSPDGWWMKVDDGPVVSVRTKDVLRDARAVQR